MPATCQIVCEGSFVEADQPQAPYYTKISQHLGPFISGQIRGIAQCIAMGRVGSIVDIREEVVWHSKTNLT